MISPDLNSTQWQDFKPSACRAFKFIKCLSQGNEIFCGRYTRRKKWDLQNPLHQCFFSPADELIASRRTVSHACLVVVSSTRRSQDSNIFSGAKGSNVEALSCWKYFTDLCRGFSVHAYVSRCDLRSNLWNMTVSVASASCRGSLCLTAWK